MLAGVHAQLLDNGLVGRASTPGPGVHVQPAGMGRPAEYDLAARHEHADDPHGSTSLASVWTGDDTDARSASPPRVAPPSRFVAENNVGGTTRKKPGQREHTGPEERQSTQQSGGAQEVHTAVRCARIVFKLYKDPRGTASLAWRLVVGVARRHGWVGEDKEAIRVLKMLDLLTTSHRVRGEKMLAQFRSASVHRRQARDENTNAKKS